MTRRVAIILSGCGVYDGSEIYESVLTLLRLDQNGTHHQCFAPDDNQHHVVNHIDGKNMSESRNMLIESARLARGDIKPISELSSEDYDALIIPGGFGAVKNLSDFAFSGCELTIRKDVLKVVQGFHKANKPIGLMCIAPAMAGKIFGNGVRLTIGNDQETACAIEATGAVHTECAVHDIIVDKENKLVTTPAYMLASSISEAASGINRLVDKVLELC